MAKFLTKEEIKLRFVEWRNLKRLHPAARRRVEELETENKKFREELKDKDAQITKLLLRVEELEKMVFGKAKKNNSNPGQFDFGQEKNRPATKQPRLPLSFRRKIPGKDQVTQTCHYRLNSNHCPDCRAPLKDLKQTEQFKEDIIILKTVQRQIVESGYCGHCRKRISIIPLANQTAYLGPNVRQLIAFANINLRLSYQQIKDLLAAAGLDISDNEITRILDQQARKLLPAASKINELAAKEIGAHYDESTWKIFGADGWVWVKTAVTLPLAMFSLGQSRGGGNIESLGPKPKVGISDNYAAYKNAFDFHQLCWAHPLRKLKDLATSEVLSEKQRKICFNSWQALNLIHEKLKCQISKPFNQIQRKRAKTRLMNEFAGAAKPCKTDPLKLGAIKKGLNEAAGNYFTCLDFEGIPTTNNKAERALRHLVIKRGISFGSKSAKGAHTASILNTVLLSLKWLRPKNYFAEFAKLLAGDFSFLETAAG